MPKILVVDDEQSICWGIEKLGRSLGWQVLVASTAEQGLRLAVESQPDLLILDVRLPGMDGLTAMSEFRRILDAVPIVVITAFGDLDTAVKAVQNGAFEYLLKPFDLQEIRSTIRRALLTAQTREDVQIDSPVGGMIGKTPVMQDVFKRIALAAAADVPVLLEGESGTGKTLAARTIHLHSPRAHEPFVVASLAALELAQADAQLWGTPDAPGLWQKASGGTLFLEDVQAMPLALQVKVSHMLDSGPLTPESHAVPRRDVRIVASTPSDLAGVVQSGEFRTELFYQLNEFSIHLPPLRERLADIPLLARHFAASRRSTSVTFAEETIDELIGHPWHGNVRELRSAIEHALVVARFGIIMPEHLPAALPPLSAGACELPDSLGEFARRRADDLLSDPQAEGFVYEKFLEEVEPALLESAMDRFSHECAPAARALGLHRTTLKRKLEQYRISR